jgi:hypothetical protein
MPGLLDDYGALLGNKPKIMPGLDPTAPVAMTAGDELDPTMGARRAEALEVRGAPPPNVPGGTLAGPNQQRAFAWGDQPSAGFPARNLSIAQADAAPPKTNLAELGFGLGDRGFPTPKLTNQLPQGNPMQPPAVAGGPPSLLDPSPQFAPNTPAPPPQVAGGPPMPPPRPPGLGGPPQMAGGPPMPPPRPPGLGGTQVAGGPPTPAPMTPGGNPAPPPNPILPPSIGAPPPGMGGGPPTPAPIAPASAPVAAAPAAAAAAAPAAAGAVGGAAGGLGGIFSGLAGIAKGLQGKGGPPPPPAKAPQIQPMQPDTASAGRAAGAQAAMQGNLGGGLLSSPTLIDPRKRMQGLA